jgi:peptide/nickel transport system substrate-binding protein
MMRPIFYGLLSEEVSMLKKRRLIVASTLLALLGLLMAACGGTTSPTPGTGPQSSYKYVTPPQKGGTLVYSDWQFPESVNPLFAASVVDTKLIDAIWGAPLVISSDAQYLPDELTEVPSQKNGDISADGLTVTLKLRHDLKWSDGQPLTSADFIYMLKTINDSATAPIATVGYDPSVLGSYTAPDPYTVVLKYVKPFASFIAFLPYPLPQHAWSSIADNALQTTQKVNIAPDVTSGPYVVQDYASDQSYTLVPNKYYVSSTLHPAVLSKLVFKAFSDKDALIAGFQAAETDQAEDFTPADLQKVQGLAGLQVTPKIESEHLDFNLSNPALQDVHVRQAIAEAIDRCQIIQTILHEKCADALTNSLAPSPSPFYDSTIKGYAFDLKAAKADMQAAGWNCSANPCTKNGQPFPKLNLVTTSGNQVRLNSVQLVQADLAALGIPVNIDGQQYSNGVLFGDYNSGGILETGKYDLDMSAYSYPLDGYAALNYFQSTQIPSAQNPAGTDIERINDPKIDDLINQALATVDPAKNAAIYKQLLNYASAQMYELPLYARPNINLVDNRVGNFFANPTSQGDQWNIGDWYTKGAQ